MKKVLLSAVIAMAAGAVVLLWMQSREVPDRQVADALPQASRHPDAGAASSGRALPSWPGVSRRKSHQASAVLDEREKARAASREATLKLMERVQKGDALAIAELTASAERSREAQRKRLRDSLSRQHAGLGKALNLSAEEESRILDALADSHPESQSVVLIAPGIAPDRPAAVRQEDALKNLLGSRYDAWEAYKLAPEIRTSVTRFQDVFGPDANPLSEEQTESLVAALTAEQLRINRYMQQIRPPPATSSRSRLENELDQELRFSADNNRRLAAVAARHVNAGQLNDYQKMLQDDLDRRIGNLRQQIAQLDSLRQN